MLFCQYKRNASSSLKEEIRPDGKAVSFKYDALGRRIQKAYNKKITRWVWDGNTPLHEWIEASGEENKQPEGVITWVFDEGRFCPAARLVGDKAYSIITDYLGTPVQAYNESGKLKWETELDIYGKVRTFEGDKALIPFRYQGQYEDEETGLYYNRFRYYSPDEGIYLSQDPIGLSGGNPTLYGYVHDPNGWVDVFGLDCKKVKQLQEGKAGAVVTVKSKAEADALLKKAFPNYQKVKGIGSESIAPQNRSRIPNKMERFEDIGKAYHKDYYVDPKTGRVPMHGEGKPWHDAPHIDINRGSNGTKDIVHIVIRK